MFSRISSIVLSNHLNIEPEDRALSELYQRITGHRSHYSGYDGRSIFPRRAWQFIRRA